MIVEQRIGRIQRLSSNFANVSIFNIVLKGTFEEYIVGRLMEKLQMASHAIGDIEALLEASGIDEEENGSNGFEEKIRQLVVASLAGRDIQKATLKAEKSILEAKLQLEQEEKNINTLLGKMDGAEDAGPKCPKLPHQLRSMDSKSFVLAALEDLGIKALPEKSGLYRCEIDGQRQLINFDTRQSDSELRTTLYFPGSPAFERLVTKITSKDLHDITDLDRDPLDGSNKLSWDWVKSFNGKYKSSKAEEIWRCFEGTALVRIRATVACDSYERLVEVSCSPFEHRHNVGKAGLDLVEGILEDPSAGGINKKKLLEKALQDQGIAEFCRFYIERRNEEIKATGNDLRKKKKIEDDFTPRLDISLVGLQGNVYRQLKMGVVYTLEGEDFQYESTIDVIPTTSTISNKPEMGKCQQTGKIVPKECIGKCEISGLRMLHSLFSRSEISNREALPEYIVICSATGKHVIKDEVELSDMTQRYVIRNLLKISALSGKRAEPKFFTRCEFTQSEVLESETAVSQISGKKYRIDEQLQSNISGKTGHRDEFIFCAETKVPILITEAETCDITGKKVVPGLLEKCEITGKKVLPSELEKSAVSGKKALKKFFVSSSISGARLLEEEAVKSITGKYCASLEAKRCEWSDRPCHPEDIRTCQLTGLEIHFEHVTNNGGTRLGLLVLLLDGILRKSDNVELWTKLSEDIGKILDKNNTKILASALSPSQQKLAVCAEIRSWGGLQVRHVGFIYSLKENLVIGRIANGKREATGWLAY
jgi:hypothetical protein